MGLSIIKDIYVYDKNYWVNQIGDVISRCLLSFIKVVLVGLNSGGVIVE